MVQQVQGEEFGIMSPQLTETKTLYTQREEKERTNQHKINK